jgi:hypothetical protein
MVTGRPIAAEARDCTIGMNQSQFQKAASAISNATGTPIQARRRVVRGSGITAKRPAASLGFRNIYQICLIPTRRKFAAGATSSLRSHSLFARMKSRAGNVPFGAIVL